MIRKKHLFLVVILALAAFFRLYGLNWGRPFSLHIDERNVQAVTWKLAGNIRTSGSFNPMFSAYGALLFYLILPLKLIFHSPENLLLGSRVVGACLGIFTVFVIYRLGEKFHDSRVGLLAAVFTACSVVLWRESHFYTAETPLLLFIALALNAGFDILKTREKRYYLWFGIFMGLAASVKLVSILLIVPLITAHLGYRNGFGDRVKAMLHPSVWATILLSITIFLGLNPYCLLEPASYWRKSTSADLLWNALMVKGIVLPPWTVQFLDRVKGLYELTALYPWAVGFPLALALFLSVFRALNKTDEKYYYLLSWILPYLILTANWQVKFIRYTIPVIPFLNILAADWLTGGRWRSVKLRNAIILSVVLGTFIYSAAYLNIYRHPDSRIEASRFLMNEAVGKKTLTEVDEGFILTDLLPENHGLSLVNLDLFYQNNNPRSRKALLDIALKKADYLILSSNNYSRFARLPKRFPVLSRFYRELFAERLGFVKIKSFKRYPRIFGWTIKDDYAELTFRLFDHPRITIFKKMKPNQGFRAG